MKKQLLVTCITLLALSFASCNNSSDKQSNYSYNDYTQPLDSTINDSIIDDKQRNIPIGYTRDAFHEYVPQNAIEKQFLSDMHSFSEAINTRNSKKVVELYYPDYFVLLQKQAPEKSVKQIKEKVRSYYEANFNEIIAAYTKDWNEAKRAGICITNIVNRVTENGKILYLYEYHTTLSSDEVTIYKKEAEYSVSASLNNGKQWYSSADNINDIFEILSISFSRAAIDKVLTKQ
jgi:hypothetical protein